MTKAEIMMEPEEGLQQLAPEPEVQVWLADKDGVLRLVQAESAAQHDDRMRVAEIWAATQANDRRLAGDHGGRSMGEMLEMLKEDDQPHD